MKQETMITVHGYQLSSEMLCRQVNIAVSVVEYHSKITEDISEAPDEVTRTQKVAANFTANTAQALGKKLVDLIETGNGYAVELGFKLIGKVFEPHDKIWVAYDEKCHGKDANVLTEDRLTERRGLLEPRLASAKVDAEAAKTALQELPSNDPRRLATKLFLEMVQVALELAVISFKLATGKFKTKGIKDGALLTTEFELNIVEEGLILLMTAVKSPIPVYDTTETVEESIGPGI